MKINILQENLIRALHLGVRFVDNKPLMPILGNILISTNSGGLTLTASNMETGVQVNIPAQIHDEGACCVPARMLTEYVNLLPPGKMELTSDEQSLKIKQGGHSARFSLVKRDDFPDLPITAITQTMELSFAHCEDLVRLTAFAASQDDARPVLGALLLEATSNQNFKAVTTDGYRLSLVKALPYQGTVAVEKMLIPMRVLTEVVRLMKDQKSASVKIGILNQEKSLLFEFGQVKIVSRLIDGDFPNYAKILPKEDGITIETGKVELVEAVKIASVFARESANIVKLTLDTKRLSISANASQVGDQESVLTVGTEYNDTFTIAFNAKYLLDWLGSVKGNQLKIIVSDSLLPGLFFSEDQDFCHVIMPVRTS